MKKIALFGVTLLASFTLVACSSNQSTETTSSSSATEQVTDSGSTNNSNEQKTELRTSFDAIVVGDLMNNGEGGSTKESVIKALGDANSTSTTSVNGLNVEQLSWLGNGATAGTTITIQFINNNVTSKAITGFQFAREAKIGLTEFNSLADGISYADAINTLGEPDSVSESLIAGSKSITASWVTGVKGNLGSNIALQFMNDSLTTKAQSGLTD